MLAMKAYFDETGHSVDPNTKLLGVVGCMTAAELWNKIESRWRAALDSEGLPYFHMSEYAQSRGAFENWKGDETRRRKIYSKLWDIIFSGALMPIGSFVLLENYNQILKGQEHNIFEDAYHLCYLQCLKFARDDYGPYNFPVELFFDNKKGVKGFATDIYNQLIVSGKIRKNVALPVYCDMRQVLPLQIADILAYESKKELERRLLRPNDKPRWGFSQLDKLIRQATPGEPVPFGEPNCHIAFHSSEELENVSKAQKQAFDEE